MEALGLVPDVVLDITVEGNRPDAWSMTGIARDLAARLGLPFSAPEPPAPPAGGVPVESLASASVESLDLCPRLTVSVLRGVVVAPSPQWIARRLLLAGMRPINNVVDASNYVMLELGQPTHPYDLSRLPGRGLSVRRARPGETVETLDGVARTVGVRGRSLGDTGEDCLICDAEGTPVGIAGIMGGDSSGTLDTTTEVLLEAAYFTPMAIARTSKRLGLRTEASARFERGTDPWGIEPSVARFCQLLGESVPGLQVADGMLDVRGDVPEPFVVSVPVARVHRQIGVELSSEEIARLIGPIGFEVLEHDSAGDGSVLTVLVPTNRPDVRPEPYGVDDVIEEVARTFGYSNVPRHVPTWPQPGRLNDLQRSRRVLKDVMLGLGASEGWTDTFVSAAAHADLGLTGEAVRVSNPLDAEKPYLRRSLLPGLLSALSYNADRRQGEIRLFEDGVVFSHPSEGHPRLVERAGAGGTETAELPGERELLCAVFARDEDDAAQRRGGLARDRRGVPPRRRALRTSRRRRRHAAPAGIAPDPLRSLGRPRRGWEHRLHRRRGGGRSGCRHDVRADQDGRRHDVGPPHRLARSRARPPLRRDAGAPSSDGGWRRQPFPVLRHRPGLGGRGPASGGRRSRCVAGGRRRPARVGPSLRRLPGSRDRRRVAQPGLPPPVLRARPHVDRRGGR